MSLEIFFGPRLENRQEQLDTQKWVNVDTIKEAIKEIGDYDGELTLHGGSLLLIPVRRWYNNRNNSEVYLVGELCSRSAILTEIEDREIVDIEVWDIDRILNEINSDTSDGWTDYDESDWEGGWSEWVEGDSYTLLN